MTTFCLKECKQNFWESRCWMGLWAKWSSERCSCPWQAGWNYVIFKVPFNTEHSMILWFVSQKKKGSILEIWEWECLPPHGSYVARKVRPSSWTSGRNHPWVKLLSVVTEWYLTKAFPSLSFYKAKETEHEREGENSSNCIISNIHPSHISLRMVS